MCNTVLSTFNSCDPHASLTHTACCCMVVLSGISLADSFLHWRFPSKIFSGEFGGSYEIATLKVCIKLHILTVFLIALYAYLTTLQERPASQTPICFMTPLLYSTPMCSLQLAAITIVLTNTSHCRYFEEDLICADFARHLASVTLV